MINYQSVGPMITTDILCRCLMVIPFIIFALLLTHISLKRTPKYRKESMLNIPCMSVALLTAAYMYFFFGSFLFVVKGIVLTVLFIYASVCDYRERKVPDCISVMVMLVGLIAVKPIDILFRLAATIVVFAFLLLFACLKKSKIGGADIKFSSACCFVVGLMKGIDAVIIGLALSVICTLIRNRILKSKDWSLPLIPYLSIGFMTVILIGGF